MIAVDYPFRVIPGAKIATTKIYERVVRGQVIDALMTNQGERVMHPNYGCDIQAALFDPSDELVRRDAASMIKERLQRFVTRCIVKSVEVEIAPDPWIVYVNIVYKPSLYSTDAQLSVPIASEFIRRNLDLAEPEEGF